MRHLSPKCLRLAWAPAWLALLIAALPAAALDILFIGNSFTHAGNAYNSTAITDLNGSGHGGVPGIFRKLADEAGHTEIEVFIEAVGGQTLAFHLAQRTSLIDRAWDVVVLQEHSVRPLVTHPSGNIPEFRRAIGELAELLRTRNPEVRIFLYQTWARPDLVPSRYPDLASMQDELRDAYSAAAADFNLAGWVPVGDMFGAALDQGIAFNPNDGEQPGRIDLWGSDRYHASAHGSYLAALCFLQHILGADPTTLPTGAGSAVTGLGLSSPHAIALQHLVRGPAPDAHLAVLLQPQSTSSAEGGSASFSIFAIGSASLQWRRAGAPLEGANQPVLTLADVSPGDAGTYDVLLEAESGAVLQSATANLTVVRRPVATQRFLVDLGSADHQTPSPDGSALHWNQLVGRTAGSAIPLLVSTSGDPFAVSLAVTTSFSGINTTGVNTSTLYPAQAQRDSFYVTGTGSVGSSPRGVLVLGDLPAHARVDLRLFGSRTTPAARVTRHTVQDLPPQFLDAVDNTHRVVDFIQVVPDAGGDITLTVEPYNAAGVMQEYGYLGVLDITVHVPSAYSLWAQQAGLDGSAADPLADPNRSGLPNLLEFAWGGDPTGTSPRSMLESWIAHADGADRFHLRIPRHAAAAFLHRAIESSTDLTTWLDVTTSFEEIAADTHSVSLRDSTSATTQPRFFRIRYALPPEP